MAWIKVTDIAYGRLRAPDLDVMEEFLTHFGMVKAERTRNALYMRATDPAHHIHVTDSVKKPFASCCNAPLVELHVRPVRSLAMLARGW